MLDSRFEWNPRFVKHVYDEINSDSLLFIEHPVGEKALDLALLLAGMYSTTFKTLFFTGTGLGVEHFLNMNPAACWFRHEVWGAATSTTRVTDRMIQTEAEVVVLDLFIPNTYPSLAHLLTTKTSVEVGKLIIVLVPSLEEISRFLRRRGVGDWGVYLADNVYSISVHGVTGVPQLERWGNK